MTTNTLEEIRMINNADLLLRHGYSMQPVIVETGLSQRQVSRIKNFLRNQNGCRIAQNRRNSSNQVLKNYFNKFQASMFIGIYLKLAKVNNREKIDMTGLTLSYRVYETLYLETCVRPHEKGRMLDINEAWILADAYRCNIGYLLTCYICGQKYFDTEKQITSIDCPYCAKPKKL